LGIVKNREKQHDKNQNEQRSNVSQNVPKIPFTKNKVLKNMQGDTGNLVMYAHDNFALVANMMIGIKKAVDSVLEYPEVHSEDFQIVSKFYIVPWAVLNDRENTTKFKNCKFIDYAPQVFYNIRRIFHVKNKDYTRALGPQQLLAAYRGNFTGFTELASTGKSGSFFYYSYDSKFILKTVSEDEFHFLRQILPDYYEHIKNHPNTLMTRFYGCHKIIFYRSGIGRSKEFRFVIMNNVFSTGHKIHVRYDLKGSSVGRQVFTKLGEIMYFYTIFKKSDPTISRKELDLLAEQRKFILEKEQKKLLMETIKHDCNFFEKQSVNDYSLLIGVHKIDPNTDSQVIKFPNISSPIPQFSNVQMNSSSTGFMVFSISV